MSASAPATGSLALATVAGPEYLPAARVLARSLARFHPELPLFLLSIDRPPLPAAAATEPFAEVLSIEDLAIPDLPSLLFRYGPMPLAVVGKERIVSHLLDRGFRRVLFLDADLLALAPLGPWLEALADHDLLLTPHHLAPLAGADRIERERTILRAGTFNAGVVGYRSGPATRAFLAWWRERLRLHAVRAPERGLHHDQRWLDLAPALVESVGVVRDPGVNVAYWNLPERPIGVDPAGYTAAGETLRLLHLSGFDPRTPEALSRHAPGLPTAALGPGRALAREYADSLAAAGWGARTPHAWDRFDDGTPIPPIAREIYRELGDDVARFGDPFRGRGAGTFRAWLGEPEPGERDRALPRLWRAVHRSRADLLAAFPDPAGRDRDAFVAWIRHSSPAEHGVAPGFFGDAG